MLSHFSHVRLSVTVCEKLYASILDNQDLKKSIRTNKQVQQRCRIYDQYTKIYCISI